MGLDIYFHLTKVNTNNEPNKVIDETEKAYKEDFSKVYDKAVAKLRKTTETDYDKVYERTIKKLAKLCNYPMFDLNPIGYEYDWKTGEVTIVPVAVEAMECLKNKVLHGISAKYDAYFRKVNFLYKYFEDTMVDEWYAPVTTADLEDIIERCDRILKDKDEETAHAELPTQSGFFFGSTDYDDWYFHDVKDCKKQLKRFLKLMQKNGDNAYIIFSW